MPKFGRNDNVYIVLRTREYSRFRGDCIRKNWNVLRTLICRGDVVYKKVWEKHSKSNISFEGNRVYFENYRLCYGGYSQSLRPRLMYRLPGLPAGKKLEDALLCHAQPECIPQPHMGHKASLIALSSHGWLIRYDLSTGQILQQVFLSSRYCFRGVAWISPQESFVLRSTHRRMTDIARQAGISVFMVMVLAVFEVFPLKFIGMMEVDKRVFGKDVMDAMISQGLLIVMHQSGHVKIYSFPYILEKYRKFEVDLHEPYGDAGHVCGLPDNGLPLNIHVTECPPVLFQVKCAEHSVEMGGFPWHYLITPYGSSGYFHVFCVETNTLAKNGVLDMENLSIEPDRAVFHGDESGRILHIGASEVRLLKVVSSENGGTELVNIATINMEKERKQGDEFMQLFTVTSSGRVVRRKSSQDEVCEQESPPLTIHDVEYENELDLLYVTAVYHEPDGTSIQGIVSFLDNLTGELLQKVPLEEPWKEYFEHRVYVDLDTIIQVIKPKPSKFTCLVYRLFSRDAMEEMEAASPSRRQKSGTSSPPVSRRRRTRRN